MLELGAGFHPDFSGRENVYMNASIYGLSSSDVDERLTDIIDFAEIEDFIDMPVRTYSSGMYMRLAFAIAAHVSPDVLLLDEVLAVGDESFQRKCMARIAAFRREGGTLVFVSHDPVAVQHICDRAIVIAGGKIVADGPTAEALDAYHRRLAASPTDSTQSVEAAPTAVHQEGSVPAALPGAGDLRARITAARVRNRLGRRASSFATGDALTLELEIETDGDVRSPVVVTEIRSDSGACIYGTNTRLEATGCDEIGRRAVLRWRVARLPFLEGHFWITAAVLSEDLAVTHHMVEKVTEFSVFQQGKGTGLVLMETSYEWGGYQSSSELDGDLALKAPKAP